MADRRPTVLVVDDYATYLRFAKDLLEPDFCIDTALTYEEALAKLRSPDIQYDVAILDIRLDDRNELDERGLELLKDIQTLGGYTQGIIWTGYETFQTMRTALRSLTAFDYLLKNPQESTLDVNLYVSVQKAAERAWQVKAFPSVPQRRKILLVEMQSLWLERIEESLRDSGYEIVAIPDYEKALDWLEKEYFRLVIVGIGAYGDLESEEAFYFLADLRERSPESDIVLLSPFDAAVSKIAQAIRQYGVLSVFPKSDPFDTDRFSEFITDTLAPSTQKYLIARLLGAQPDQSVKTGSRYQLEIQGVSALPKDAVYTSFPMSPAQSPVDLLARFHPYDMEVHSPLEHALQMIFDKDTSTVYFEFTILRPGRKELIVDFYVRPQLRWLRRISLVIQAESS